MASIESVLNWLRAGYPEGVAPNDVAPIVALLRRALTDEEVDQVVAHLQDDDPRSEADRASVTAAIEDVANTVPTQEEVAAVATRLAQTGWPLADDLLREHGEQGWLQRILNWLRAGYPQGVPPTDYQPVLALLRRQLSEEEADAIALKVIADARAHGRMPDQMSARTAILRTTDELQTDDDVRRVESHLREYGWPFEASDSR